MKKQQAYLSAGFTINIILVGESATEENPTVNLYEFVKFRDEVEEAIKKALSKLKKDNFSYRIWSEPIQVEVEIPI